VKHTSRGWSIGGINIGKNRSRLWLRARKFWTALSQWNPIVTNIEDFAEQARIDSGKVVLARSEAYRSESVSTRWRIAGVSPMH
jgi:hypothetical protein